MASRDKNRFEGIEPNEDGIYEYTGDYFRISDESGGSGRWSSLVVMLLLSVVLVILSGLSRAEAATSAFYVILPYVGEVTSMFVLAWQGASALWNKDKVRGTKVNRAHAKIIGGSTLLAAFAGLGSLMSCVYIFRHGMGESIFQSASYPVIKLITAVLAWNFRKIYDKTKWTQVP